MLIVYSAVLIKVMVLKELPLIRIGSLMINFGGTHEGPPNLLPFKTILPYLLGEKGLMIAFINLAGNIVLLVPIGFLVPFIYRSMTWKKSLALAFAAGLTIEGMQVLLHVGIFDIDDVILNGLGVMIGYWVFVVLAKRRASIKAKHIIFTTVIMIAAAAAIYGIAVDQMSRLPGVHGRVDVNNLPDHPHKQMAAILQGEDPCGGTGGTGQIISLGNSSITIKRNDGVNEIIRLTDKTVIKNAVVSLLPSDLKIGNRVTVVVLTDHIATTVLVCNGSGTEPVK